jgi:hypothetical protein
MGPEESAEEPTLEETVDALTEVLNNKNEELRRLQSDLEFYESVAYNNRKHEEDEKPKKEPSKPPKCMQYDEHEVDLHGHFY